MSTKTYRKTATIQAERFSGTAPELQAMVEKYRLEWIADRPGAGHDGNWFVRTLEGALRVNVGDWIATGGKGEHWPIRDDIFRASYVEVSP